MACPSLLGITMSSAVGGPWRELYHCIRIALKMRDCPQRRARICYGLFEYRGDRQSESGQHLVARDHVFHGIAIDGAASAMGRNDMGVRIDNAHEGYTDLQILF